MCNIFIIAIFIIAVFYSYFLSCISLFLNLHIDNDSSKPPANEVLSRRKAVRRRLAAREASGECKYLGIDIQLSLYFYPLNILTIL